jgi:glycosyltransferase involved in cell wall biosynthesis
MPAPLVLHVLPIDLARGAQTYARELRTTLDGPAVRHRTVTLFDSPSAALRPDWTLAVPDGVLRRAGLDPRVLTRLRRLVGTEHPAIVVAHGSEPLKYAVLAGVPRRRLVALKIGANHTRLGGVRGWVYRALLLRSGAVAAVSEAAAAEARSYGVDGAALRVIPNGRDPATFVTHAAVTSGPGVHFVWVGHLDDAKRPVRFVELIAALREAGVDAHGSVAGDGPLLDRVREAARRTAAGAVDVLGRVENVPALLAGADALVLTSAPNEGMPGVLIEAGMAGLPTVSTDVPSSTASPGSSWRSTISTRSSVPRARSRPTLRCAHASVPRLGRAASTASASMPACARGKPSSPSSAPRADACQRATRRSYNARIARTDTSRRKRVS